MTEGDIVRALRRRDTPHEVYVGALRGQIGDAQARRAVFRRQVLYVCERFRRNKGGNEEP